MDRREFVKLGGMAALLWMFPSSKSAFALPANGYNGKHYRGARDGEIQVSHDGKRTWQKHASFGADYSIGEISARDDGRPAAKVGYRSRTFVLSLSEDETNWLIG